MSSLKPSLDHRDTHLPTVDEASELNVSSKPTSKAAAEPIDTQETPSKSVRAKSESAVRPSLAPPRAQLDPRSVSEPMGASATAAKNAFGSGANQAQAAADLVAMKPHAMSEADRAQCLRMLQITRVDEGFKAVLVSHSGRQEHVMTCHSPDQAGSTHPGEHRNLVMNLTTHLKASAETKMLSMNILKASVSRGKGWQGYMASGTRLIFSAASNTYQFSRSGLYGFGADAVDATGLQKMATLHAHLLLGSGIKADQLAPPAAGEEGMQPLHDAVVALLRAAA